MFSSVCNCFNSHSCHADHVDLAGVNSKIDKQTKQFIWSKGNNKKGLNPVNWSVLTSLKKYGGLGIRDSRTADIALLGKWVWHLINEPNRISTQVLSSKYLDDGSLFLAQSGSKNKSYVWKGINHAVEALKNGFSYRIGQGEVSV